MKQFSRLPLLLLLLIPYITIGQEQRDDTESVQELINKASPGDTVTLSNRTYHLRTIRLKRGVHLRSEGIIKQLPPRKVEDFTWAKQYSDYPLFYGNQVDDIDISFREAHTYGEAVRLDSCQRVTIRDSKAVGDSLKLQSFAGVYVSNSRDIQMDRLEIAGYGIKRRSPDYYERGTGIRMQTCQQIRIQNCDIRDNAENGIFMHSCADVDIRENEIDRNGMSGIQVAFGSVGVERDYRITGNKLEGNAADAIDINNPDTARMVEINAYIAGNTSKGNGWVKGDRTRDGSGIATLVGLKQVVVKGNRSERSNRPGVYIRECDSVKVVNNQSDNFAEIVGKQGSIYLAKNTFSGLRVLRDLRAEKLRLDSNRIAYLAIHDGIQVDSLVFVANKLNGNINFHLDGNLVFKDNSLSSKSPRGAINLRKATGAMVVGNQISADTTADALYIEKEATNVVIVSNKIHSREACIRDGGSPQLKVIGNTLTPRSGTDFAPAFISSNPQDLLIRENRYPGHENLEKQRLIVLEGGGSATIDSASQALL